MHKIFKKISEVIKEAVQNFNEKSLKNRKWLFDDDLAFRSLEVYVDEEHVKRELMEHIPSGELYFHEWYEEIDWVNGNDPQYNIYIPVDTPEEAERCSTPEITYFGGSDYTPRIIDNLYADDTRELRWVRE